MAQKQMDCHAQQHGNAKEGILAERKEE